MKSFPLPLLLRECASAILLLAATWSLAAHACDPQAKFDERSPKDAWPLRIRFMPCDSEIYGIPVQRIHPSWRRASVTQFKNIPIPELQPSGPNGFEYGEAGPFSFELMGDFNRDGRPDRAAVGVYEINDGKSGRFMLIVTRTDSGAWRRVFLSQLSGEPGFLALGRNRSRIAVRSCLDCDDDSEVEWNPKAKKYAVRK